MTWIATGVVGGAVVPCRRVSYRRVNSFGVACEGIASKGYEQVNWCTCSKAAWRIGDWLTQPSRRLLT